MQHLCTIQHEPTARTPYAATHPEARMSSFGLQEHTNTSDSWPCSRMAFLISSVGLSSSMGVGLEADAFSCIIYSTESG